MVKLKRKLFLSRIDWRTLALVFAGAFLGTGLILGGINKISKLVFAVPTVPVPSISLTSQHSSYASDTPGAWNVEKSAKWTGTNTARITFEVDTNAKIGENLNYDIILVADVSGSMSGSKLAQVKADATDLAESLLHSGNNRMALVSFESTAHIESGFTSDKTLILQKIDALSDTGATNYYDGLVKAEEVLEGYTQQPNRELILLFLTDGFPNMDTPNEVGQYELLKQKYPYMTINGIQYEMGDTVLDPIKAVSDNQFIATMPDLNNVLFDASVMSFTYSDFILTDFIDDNYFTIGNIGNILVDRGTVNLDYDGDTPKVTWDLSGLRSGNSAHMTIDVTLKNTYITTGGLYPTNKRTTVESVLDDTPTENIITANTPVLKNSYNVTYEANLPNDCTVSGMPNPLTEEHFIFSTVEINSVAPSCGGYNFAGYVITTPGVKKMNDDYFIMPEKDVTIRATWTKVSLGKSMDGTVHETKTATFDSGSAVNVKMKKLSGQSSATSNTANTSIVAFKRADLLSENVNTSNSNYRLSSASSQAPIYGWFDSSDSTIYYYTEADIVSTNNLNLFFRGMKSITDVSGLADLDITNITELYRTFEDASSLTDISVLSGWNTSQVTNMGRMFYGASSLADISALSSWNTSSVTDVSFMLGNTAITSTSALANWNTSSVTDMSDMFYNDTSLTNISALANWNTSSVTDMGSMFSSASSLADISALSGWNTSSVTDMNNMFSSVSSLSDISALSGWDTSSVTDMGHMLRGTAITSTSALANWNTSSVTNMSGLFYQITSLSNISALANWNTSSVTSMSSMFYNDTSLTNISALASWNTSSVTSMSDMFSSVSSLSDISALSGWDTSSVKSMSYMFSSTSALTDISALSGWNTSSVTNMSYMFYKYNTGSLTDISALSGWNTSSVTNMNSMFYRNQSLRDISALSGWNTSQVTNMGKMFYEDNRITSLAPLNNWDTSNVTNMTDIFYGIPSSVPRPSWY